MPQTFYIENDEEIISVIGRLRKSGEIENVFVFPKRALVLQSIVNLRLFQREAQKLGKKITLVTQDDIGRMLAEKAGIPTETYSDDFSQKAHHLELSQGVPVTNIPPREGFSEEKPLVVRAESIGSSDFYGGTTPAKTLLSPEGTPTMGQKLRIRNASPERPPSLNSERFREQVSAPSPVKPLPVPPAFQPTQPQSSYATPVPRPSVPPQSPNNQPAPYRQDALKRFFLQENGPKTAPTTAPKPAPVSVEAKKAPSPRVHAKASKVLTLFAFVSLVSLFGLLAYLFFPKVTVKIAPLTSQESVDLRLIGMSSPGDSPDQVATKFIEKEVTVTVIEKASGTSASSNQKARGTVVLYNDFSKEPQSLVATTRLETPDGKIFRLVESVTVPGQTTTPGAIEASVIADQTGEDYNIDPATFTIPGFKGSPKFEKFSAKSVKKMNGGGNAGSELLTIAKTDLEKAEASARARAEETFFAELSGTLLEKETFLRESMEITPNEAVNLPQIGSATEDFEYTRTYKVRGFVVSEVALEEKAALAAPKEVGGIPVTADNIRLDLGEIAPDFEKKEVSLRVHADISQVGVINEERLKEELLGQDAKGIEALLGKHPEIQKIELSFHPDWFGSRIPKSSDRVLLEIAPEEAKEE